MAATVLQQRGEVLVDGKRLETLWIEPADKDRPTIVMLHEGLGSVALWKDFPQRLASRTGCGILVYSRYGHGNSDRLLEKRPVEFMHHEGEKVLPELLDKLNIVKPILLGHSDGGSISLIFAGEYPDRPRALILEAPHVCVEDLSVASITQAKVAYLTTELPRKLWAVSPARGCDLLGLERHLARSAISVVEHRKVFAGDTLQDSVHSGRR
jgi:pimeloyl-ACP methyl ester carboxylesterase